MLQGATNSRALGERTSVFHRSSCAAAVLGPDASAADHRPKGDQNRAGDEGARCGSQVPAAHRSDSVV